MIIMMPHKIVDDLNRQERGTARRHQGRDVFNGREALAGTYDSAKESVTDKYDDIAGASVEKQREYVIGKTAGNDVIIPADKATMATPAALSVGSAESGADVNAPSAGQLTSGLDIAPKGMTAATGSGRNGERGKCGRRFERH